MSSISRLLPALVRRLRPLLHLGFLLSRGLTLGVRAAILDGDGRVFLVRHTYVTGWHLPGGGVEPGETLREALAREMREEAAIEPAEDAVAELHGVFLNDHASRRDHVAVFVVRAFRVREQKRPDREIADAGFFPLDALPAGTTAGTRARLAEIAAGGEPASRWSAGSLRPGR